ncbi:MAG TPA: succinylglutamate desuccinylase/aspartoacylase family protein [Candidatus Nanoarchaeia archaeon]|nr:succinylglutamate desuccinylase/aspartoacylase family protein [Candidatus Nanoarchaeia archaeon]
MIVGGPSIKVINYIADNAQKSVCFITGIHGDEAFLFQPLLEFLSIIKHDNINIKLILANEEAFLQDKRYIDQDLNRIFNQNKKVGNEANLVSQLMKEGEGDLIVDFHSHSGTEQFALVRDEYLAPGIKRAIEALGVPHCISISPTVTEGGSLVENIPHSFSVETGKHKSEDAIEFAKRCIVRLIALLSEQSKGINQVTFLRADKFLFNTTLDEIRINKNIKNFQPISKGTEISEGIRAIDAFIPTLVSYNVKPNEKILLICQK